MLNTTSHQIGAAEIQQMVHRARAPLADIYLNLIEAHVPKTPRFFRTRDLAKVLGGTWDRKKINHKLARQTRQISKGSFEGVVLPNGKDRSNPKLHPKFTPEEVLQWMNAHYRLDRCGQFGKVLTFVDHRGSIGKSEIAATLAQSLTLKGAKVLLLDFNPNGHLTEFLGCNPGADYRFGSDPNPEICLSNGDINTNYLFDQVQVTYWPNLDIVPFFPGLTDIFPNCARLVEEINFSYFRPMILSELLPSITEKYDCVIIDTASRLDASVMNAIALADGVIFAVSTKPEDFYAEQAYSLAPDYLRRQWSGFEQKTFDFWEVLLHDLDNNGEPDSLMSYQASRIYQNNFLGVRVPQFCADVDECSKYKTIYESMTTEVMGHPMFERAEDQYAHLTEFVFNKFFKHRACE